MRVYRRRPQRQARRGDLQPDRCGRPGTQPLDHPVGQPRARQVEHESDLRSGGEVRPQRRAARRAHHDRRALRPAHPRQAQGAGRRRLQVYKVTYDTSTGPVARVVKPLVSEEQGSRGLVAAKTSIPHENPRYGARNIAILLLNETLGLSVVPKTSYAIHNDRLALAMELAPGTEAREITMGSTGRTLLHYPEFQERLNDLEWLDALGGQGDRHGHNYLVGVDKSGKVAVTGIDKDHSLGKDMLNPDGYIRSSKGQVGGHNVGMPPIIGKELAKRLLALEARDTVGTPKSDPNAALKEKLAKLLTPDELDALQTRLDAIKTKIGTLQTSGHVIDDFATWKKPGDQSNGVFEVLSEAPKREGRNGQQNMPSSYLIRDFGHFVDVGDSNTQRMMAINKLGMM